MPSITLHGIEPLEGFEDHAEWRRVRRGECFLNGFGEAECWGASDTSNAKHIVLRRKWIPPKWLPEGCWVYKNHGASLVSRTEPYACKLPANGYTVGIDGEHVELATLAALHGEEFTPPPVDKIQVRHEK